MKLNEGALHSVLFTDTERRVRLERGEAFFQVTKDPRRPFVVEVGGVTVRAIGTAFNVRLGGGELDVLVAEGKVEVASTGPAQPDAPAPTPARSSTLTRTPGAAQVKRRAETHQSAAHDHDRVGHGRSLAQPPLTGGRAWGIVRPCR